MENETSNNYALSLLKFLRTRAGRGGKVQIEMSELCRGAGLDEVDARESLADLECEGYISTEIVCHISKEWR